MDDMCTACLCTGRKLYFIGETGHYHLYSQILNEIPVYDFSDVCVRVCWECRALLRRFGEFKGLVKRSYNELLQQLHQNIPPNKQSLVRAPHLQIQNVINLSYPEHEVKEEPCKDQDEDGLEGLPPDLEDIPEDFEEMPPSIEDVTIQDEFKVEEECDTFGEAWDTEQVTTKKRKKVAQCTMGQLLETPVEEKTFYENLIRTLDEIYPQNWRDWVVNDLTYTDLFGDIISSTLECTLCFAVPTIKLAKAHSKETTLSERRYKKIKRILLNWPLGRALIYTPQTIMSQIHPGRKFSKVVTKIKNDLIPRHEASNIMSLYYVDVESQPSTSNKGTMTQIDQGKNMSTVVKAKKNDLIPCQEASTIVNQSIESQPSTSTKGTKRNHSPDRTELKEPNIIEFMIRQNSMFEKLYELAKTTNDNVKSLMEESVNANSHRTSAEKQLVNYSEKEALAKSVHDFFNPTTKVTENIKRAAATLVNQAIDCQRFNSKSWQNIRYTEAQKIFQATPAFTSLILNDDLTSITPPSQLVTVMEKMDLCLAVVTHAQLQQRRTLQEMYEKCPSKWHIGKQFIKTSDLLLQYVCGVRAEIIQHRRGLYKPQDKTLNERLHSIPPSATHLFSEPELTELIEKKGGVFKLFFCSKGIP